MPSDSGVARILWLLWGTVVHRPYVYAFFACYLGFSIYQLGARKTLRYLVLAFAVALLSELCSTRWGFPFGIYVYYDQMRTQELWISNVPFWDSLSFVFLSYFSWTLAGALRARKLEPAAIAASLRAPATLLLSGFLMMLLDVVIDPVTLLGDRWFLGKVYDYPNGGAYFGVTLSNFAGWWFVGSFTPWLYQKLTDLKPRNTPRPFFWGIFAIYSSTFLFNLGITAYLQEWKLLAASSTIALTTLTAAGVTLKRRTAPSYA